MKVANWHSEGCWLIHILLPLPAKAVKKMTTNLKSVDMAKLKSESWILEEERGSKLNVATPQVGGEPQFLTWVVPMYPSELQGNHTLSLS